MLSDEPTVSIIIPTYNEAEDIGRTLDALVQLDYPHKEVIVVDASTDSTPRIVQQYEQHGVKLLKQVGRGGRAEARNQGVRAAKGGIVVILNADVLLPPNFIRRILPHYQREADYVLVGSRVANTGFLFPRYTQAQYRYTYEGQTWINWTEGFSCRREAALAVGLFPETRPIPLCAGADAIFGENLERHGYRKVIDWSTIVSHIVPHRLRDYWAQRCGRGRGVLQRLCVIQGVPLWLLRPYLVWNTGATLLRVVLLIPVLIYAWRLVRYSSRMRRWLDWLPFAFVRALELIAHRIGEWNGYRELRAESACNQLAP